MTFCAQKLQIRTFINLANFSCKIELNFVFVISVMKTEIARQGALDGVSKFDKGNLKDVETQEKNPLPDNEGKVEQHHNCSNFLNDPHLLTLFQF